MGRTYDDGESGGVELVVRGRDGGEGVPEGVVLSACGSHVSGKCGTLCQFWMMRGGVPMEVARARDWGERGSPDGMVDRGEEG